MPPPGTCAKNCASVTGVRAELPGVRPSRSASMKGADGRYRRASPPRRPGHRSRTHSRSGRRTAAQQPLGGEDGIARVGSESGAERAVRGGGRKADAVTQVEREGLGEVKLLTPAAVRSPSLSTSSDEPVVWTPVARLAVSPWAKEDVVSTQGPPAGLSPALRSSWSPRPSCSSISPGMRAGEGGHVAHRARRGSRRCRARPVRPTCGARCACAAARSVPRAAG